MSAGLFHLRGPPLTPWRLLCSRYMMMMLIQPTMGCTAEHGDGSQTWLAVELACSSKSSFSSSASTGLQVQSHVVVARRAAAPMPSEDLPSFAPRAKHEPLDVQRTCCASNSPLSLLFGFLGHCQRRQAEHSSRIASAPCLICTVALLSLVIARQAKSSRPQSLQEPFIAALLHERRPS